MSEQDELLQEIEGLLSQYNSELLAWKSWGINAVEKTHDLKVLIAQDILAKAKQHYEQKRLNRPELREKIIYYHNLYELKCGLLGDYGRDSSIWQEFHRGRALQKYFGQLLALIPDIEELDECNQLCCDFNIEEAKKQERIDTAIELEVWMDEASPYRKIAQVEHAIIKLKRGQALKETEG